MTVGVIDVGTNSVRVLITDGTGLGERDMVITRLGQGVDAAKRLAPEAIERTVEAIATFAGRCSDAGAARTRIIGTSAVRDASNREELLGRVHAVTGMDLEVIPGETEARLAFAGAIAAVEGQGPFLVCDIGGGSTELIIGTDHIDRAVSLDIGSVRLTERHVHNDPPGEDERDALARDARAALAGADLTGASTMIGVAGTFTTMAALALGLPAYDRQRVHRSRLSRPDALGLRDRLASMTVAQRRALPVMPPGREDVIVAGAFILAEVMLAAGAQGCIVSESDILDGAAAEIMD